MKAKRLLIEVPLVFDYVELGPSGRETEELILLLHGYEQRGQTLLDKFAEACPSTARILAPNGPFPLPRKSGNSFKVGYSWYFYDPGQDEYFIDMKTSVRALSSAIDTLGLKSIPKRIVGFSQGGYLAPFVALALKNVKQVIGISCDYLIDELPETLNFRWDGIHGDQDEIVGITEPQLSHSRLEGMGIAGKFHILEGVGHELSEGVVNTVKMILNSA